MERFTSNYKPKKCPKKLKSGQNLQPRSIPKMPKFEKKICAVEFGADLNRKNVVKHVMEKFQASEKIIWGATNKMQSVSKEVEEWSKPATIEKTNKKFTYL